MHSLYRTIPSFQAVGPGRDRSVGQQAAVSAVQYIRVGGGGVPAGAGGRGQRAGPRRAHAAAASSPRAAPPHAALPALHQATDNRHIPRHALPAGQH